LNRQERQGRQEKIMARPTAAKTRKNAYAKNPYLIFFEYQAHSILFFFLGVLGALAANTKNSSDFA